MVRAYEASPCAESAQTVSRWVWPAGMPICGIFNAIDLRPPTGRSRVVDTDLRGSLSDDADVWVHYSPTVPSIASCRKSARPA